MVSWESSTSWRDRSPREMGGSQWIRTYDWWGCHKGNGEDLQGSWRKMDDVSTLTGCGWRSWQSCDTNIHLLNSFTLYMDFGARRRYLGHGEVIISHRILWDEINHPCPRNLLLVPNLSQCILGTRRGSNISSSFRRNVVMAILHQLTPWVSSRHGKISSFLDVRPMRMPSGKWRGPTTFLVENGCCIHRAQSRLTNSGVSLHRPSCMDS